MGKDKRELHEDIQRMIVTTLATSKEGRNLHLIGGYRLRLFDNSPRMSADIDYHCSGDTGDKRQAVSMMLRQKLFPRVREELGYDGRATAESLPDEGTQTTKLTFNIKDFPLSEIEIPVDITTIEALDGPASRTTHGVVCLTMSDHDIIESKVIALLNRPAIRDRDILDIFLFEDKFAQDSPERLARKLVNMSMDNTAVEERIQQLADKRNDRVHNVSEVMAGQLDAQAAETINASGGAAAVFDRVMTILTKDLRLGRRT